MLRKLYFFKFANLKKTKQKNSTHKSLGVAAYNTCKKFQGKIVNPTLVGTPGSFFFFFLKKRQLVFGKEQIFVKNHSPVFFSAELQ